MTPFGGPKPFLLRVCHLGRALVFGPGLAILTACSGAVDLVDLTPVTTIRSAAPPLEPILVRLKADTRPSEERGVRNLIGRNYLGGNVFREPTDVSLLRILARDLVVSGVTKAASLADPDPGLTLSVQVDHLAASFESNVATIVAPVLPTSGLAGRCGLRLQLRDRAGRQFLDRGFDAEETRAGALVAGLESDAAEALSVAIRRAVDEALPSIRGSVDAFWRQSPAHSP